MSCFLLVIIAASDMTYERVWRETERKRDRERKRKRERKREKERYHVHKSTHITSIKSN